MLNLLKVLDNFIDEATKPKDERRPIILNNMLEEISKEALEHSLQFYINKYPKPRNGGYSYLQGTVGELLKVLIFDTRFSNEVRALTYIYKLKNFGELLDLSILEKRLQQFDTRHKYDPKTGIIFSEYYLEYIKEQMTCLQQGEILYTNYEIELENGDVIKSKINDIDLREEFIFMRERINAKYHCLINDSVPYLIKHYIKFLIKQK